MTSTSRSANTIIHYNNYMLIQCMESPYIGKNINAKQKRQIGSGATRKYD